MVFGFQVLASAPGGKSPAKQSQDYTSQKNAPIIEETLKEEFKIWTSPVRVKSKNLALLSGVALTTYFLLKNDNHFRENIDDFTQKNQWFRNGSSTVTRMGTFNFNIGVIGTFYLGGMIFKDDRAKTTARLGIKSILHAYAVTQVLKRIFRRQRPYLSDGTDSWFNSESGSDYRAFPSGHTTTAWSMATVIARQYRDKPAVPIICYSLATLVGISRMAENKHWGSDVLIGALIGYSIGRFVTMKANKRLVITPMVSKGHLGMQFSYVF